MPRVDSICPFGQSMIPPRKPFTGPDSGSRVPAKPRSRLGPAKPPVPFDFPGRQRRSDWFCQEVVTCGKLFKR